MLAVFFETIVASLRRMSRCRGSLGHITAVSMKISTLLLGAAVAATGFGLAWSSYTLWAVFAVVGSSSGFLVTVCAIFALDDGVGAVRQFVKQQAMREA
jgi:hypothetical protein